MTEFHRHLPGPARRDLLRLGIGGFGLGLVGAVGAPALYVPPAEAAVPKTSDRILVVVELSARMTGSTPSFRSAMTPITALGRSSECARSG